MLQPETGRGRPCQDGPAIPTTTTKIASILDGGADIVADLDARAERLNGRLAVQVVVDAELGHVRTYLYRSTAAAENAVRRAGERGQHAHVTLVQLVPVGTVVGLGVAGGGQR